MISCGLVTGSEGTFDWSPRVSGAVTPLAEDVRTLLAIFSTWIRQRRRIGDNRRGIVPAALEMMDNLPIQAVEDAYHAGYPRDAGAVLLIEIEGPARAR